MRASNTPWLRSADETSCGASETRFESKEHTADSRLGVTTLGLADDDDDDDDDDSTVSVADSLSAAVDDRPDIDCTPVSIITCYYYYYYYNFILLIFYFFTQDVVQGLQNIS